MRPMLISCSASLLALALSLSACQTAPLSAPLPTSALEIHIAHINDHHSQLDAGSAEPGDTGPAVATDAGAAEDIPAFCRMTRHELLHAAPPSLPD